MLNPLLDNISAKFPHNVALIFEGKTYTYADLCSLTQSGPSLFRVGNC